MSEICNKIIEGGLSLGACRKLKRGMDEKELARLLFSPQGREFCTAKDFPTRRDIEKFDRRELRRLGLYAEDTEIKLDSRLHDVCFIGNTRNRVKAHGPESLYHVIALDGAEVTIEASGYSVISIDASESATVKIHNKDLTSRISCHAKEK